MDTIDPVLRVDDLYTYFVTHQGVARAVDGVSFHVDKGETLGIVGESGCGKSVTALSILRLLPIPPARIGGGPITLEGQDLLALPESEIRRIRGNEISMIFQEPMTSLNPVLTVGFQMAETIRLHQKLSRKTALEQSLEMLRLVQIPDPVLRMKQYPHEMSGGMRQRVMIAMALSCRPKILIADEPTTALDVTIQAQILDLVTELKEKTGTGVIMITHDLGVVAETAQRVMVMYTGRSVEHATTQRLFAHPLHPYTLGLLTSVPQLGRNRRGKTHARLQEIPGIVPSLLEMPPGCTFAPRCPFAQTYCREHIPPLEEKESGHWVACWETERVQEAV